VPPGETGKKYPCPRVHTAEVTQSPNQLIPGASSLWVKRPEREADHSPPPSAEIKNA
jgi:hypothetical protein